MKDIKFEIVNSEIIGESIIFKVKCYEFETPFFNYSFSINKFNRMTEDEVEYQIYHYIEKRIIKNSISKDIINTKMNNVSNSINTYNSNIK